MTTSTKYLGANIATGSKNQYELEVIRCCRQIYAATNHNLKHVKELRYLSNSAKNSIISAYGTPYAIELFDNVDTRITRAHRTMVKKFYPRSFYVRDANDVDIRSSTLYGNIAQCSDLKARHLEIRTKMILKARYSDNHLIRDLIGSLRVQGFEVG